MTGYYDRLVVPVGAGLLFLALLVVVGWWSARRQPEHMAAVIWACLGALAVLGLNQVLVRLLARPRPYNVLSGVEVLVPRVHGYGTPSAHAAIAGAVVCGLMLARRWRLAGLAFLAALLLGFADVYVGADYPSAVAGGAIFGALVVLLLWPLVSWLLVAVVDVGRREPRWWTGRSAGVVEEGARSVELWNGPRRDCPMPRPWTRYGLLPKRPLIPSPAYPTAPRAARAPMAAAAVRRPVCRTGGAISSSPGDRAALELAQAAPNAVRLSDAQRVTEALLADRASGTHGLGLSFSRRPGFFAFEVRGRKKDCGRLAPTGCPGLPTLRCM